MKFYASITVSSGTIQRMFELLEEHCGSVEPLDHVVFTPIAQSESAHATVYEMAKTYDINVVFDSGGYEVQVNNHSFDSLYKFLIEYYDDNQWASKYVLPDNGPLTGDSEEVVERKVKETIAASTLCFEHLPRHIQKRSLAVVQGHTKEQVSRCIERYAKFDGLRHIGFGSFGTGGKNNGVNMLTQSAAENLKYVVRLAKRHGFTVHAFGIGGPTTIPVLHEIGVDSFDSSSWMRSGGYGNVFFPFKSRMNASHRKARTGNTLLSGNLEQIKYETSHSCPFCESMSDLRDFRWYRIMHNLIVMNDMVEQLDKLSREDIIENMSPQSTYRKILESI